jgi:hypothetical protein
MVALVCQSHHDWPSSAAAVLALVEVGARGVVHAEEARLLRRIVRHATSPVRLGVRHRRRGHLRAKHFIAPCIARLLHLTFATSSGQAWLLGLFQCHQTPEYKNPKKLNEQTLTLKEN